LIDSLKQEPENLPLEQRYGTRLMMAIRLWEIEVFRKLCRVDRRAPVRAISEHNHTGANRQETNSR